MCRISITIIHIFYLVFLLDVGMKPETAEGGALRKSRMVWYDFEKYPELKYDLPVSIYISDKFDDKEAQKIEDSFAELMCRTCLDFNFIDTPLKEGERFLRINKIKLKTSKDGVVDSGYTDGNLINLAELTRTVIVHEILHALGADHTMTRPDRDQYLRIKNPTSQEAIIPDSKTYGFPYEYDSIMHYDDFERYTVLKEPIAENSAKMGRSLTMTDNDVKLIQLVYCDNKTTTVLQPTDQQCKLAAETVAKERKEQEEQDLEELEAKMSAAGEDVNGTISGDGDRNGTISGDDGIDDIGESGSGEGSSGADADDGGAIVGMDSSDSGASVKGDLTEGGVPADSVDGSRESEQEGSV